MSILLIRHGETNDNHRRRVQLPDAKLSGDGERQAQKLAQRLSDEPITRILASDYDRAKATAEAISTRVTVPIEFDPLLRERHFGQWRGQNYDDIPINIMAQDALPPGGESWETFDLRMASLWTKLCEYHSQCENKLVVVTHGLVCFSLVRQFANLDGQRLPDKWSNTSVTEIGVAAGNRILQLNCTKHLQGAVSEHGGQV